MMAVQLVKELTTFLETQVSFYCSQEPNTGPYFEPLESSTHPHNPRVLCHMSPVHTLTIRVSCAIWVQYTYTSLCLCHKNSGQTSTLHASLWHMNPAYATSLCVTWIQYTPSHTTYPCVTCTQYTPSHATYPCATWTQYTPSHATYPYATWTQYTPSYATYPCAIWTKYTPSHATYPYATWTQYTPSHATCPYSLIKLHAFKVSLADSSVFQTFRSRQSALLPTG